MRKPQTTSSSTPAKTDTPRDVLPIFPLSNVLLPNGRMKLRIFEARYMDMITACMQSTRPFGICLIEQGTEVAGESRTGLPHRTGVEAHIVDWDMQQQGMLGITVSGGRRFRIAEYTVTARNTVEAQVDWVPETDAAMPVQYASMQSLLQLIAVDRGQEVVAVPYRFDDANWVGHRFTETLPIPPLARLRLLELEDPMLRLSIIFQYLSDHKLLSS